MFYVMTGGVLESKDNQRKSTKWATTCIKLRNESCPSKVSPCIHKPPFPHDFVYDKVLYAHSEGIYLLSSSKAHSFI